MHFSQTIRNQVLIRENKDDIKNWLQIQQKFENQG